MSFEIKNTTAKTPPRFAFERIKDAVVGKRYELSLVFCGNALSRSLNSRYRNKDKATNVLSFQLSANSGEIFINLDKLKTFKAPELFIHGLLHLKGMEHGDTMERKEKSLLKRFLKINNGSSDRRRH